jgi:hypothetical protein
MLVLPLDGVPQFGIKDKAVDHLNDAGKTALVKRGYIQETGPCVSNQCVARTGGKRFSSFGLQVSKGVTLSNIARSEI